MKQKVIHILTIVIFLGIFAFFYGEEYLNFHSEKQKEVISREIIGTSLGDFSANDIQELSGETQLYYTPDLGLLDQIVQEIDAAQQRVYLEVYIFTERDIRDALVRAHERGIEVKVLLENNPYKAPYLNDNHFNFLRDAGLDVKWSDPLNYSLNHSKLLMIDDVAYISTGNFSYSLFQYNRDFMVKLQDREILEGLKKIFLADFSHSVNIPYQNNLVISPEYSRSKLETLIDDSRESIDFYFPYMQDESFEKKLFEAAGKGIQVRGIVEQDFYEENPDIISEFGEKNIILSSLSRDDLHAKALLFDNKILYIGSINFSRYSFDENREIGILISKPEIIKKFKEIYEKDFSE